MKTQHLQVHLNLFLIVIIATIIKCSRHQDERINNGLDSSSSSSPSSSSKFISTNVQWELPSEIEIDSPVKDGYVIEGSIVNAGNIKFDKEDYEYHCVPDDFLLDDQEPNNEEKGDAQEDDEREDIINWTGKGPYPFTFEGEGELVSRRFHLSLGKDVYTQIHITDAYMPGDSFTVYVNNKIALVTPIVDISSEILAQSGDSAFNEPLFSQGSFIMRGNGVIDIFVRSSPWGGGKGFIESNLLGSRMIGDTLSLVPKTSTVMGRLKAKEYKLNEDLLNSWLSNGPHCFGKKDDKKKEDKKDDKKKDDRKAEKKKEDKKAEKKKEKKKKELEEEIPLKRKEKKPIGNVLLETSQHPSHSASVVHISINQQPLQLQQQQSQTPKTSSKAPQQLLQTSLKAPQQLLQTSKAPQQLPQTPPKAPQQQKILNQQQPVEMEEGEEEEFLGHFVPEQIDTICGAFSSNIFISPEIQVSPKHRISSAFIPHQYFIFPFPINRRQAMGLCKSLENGSLAENSNPLVMEKINAMLLKVLPIGGKIWMAPKTALLQDSREYVGELASLWTFLPIKIETDGTHSCGLQYMSQRHLGTENNWVLCQKSIGNAAV